MKKWNMTALLLAAVVAAAVATAGDSLPLYAKEQTASGIRTESEAKEQQNGIVRIVYKDNSEETIPVFGAEFTFWKVGRNGKSLAGRVRTDENGYAALTLPEGIYEGEETKPAKNHEASRSFRFSIPMKEEKGQESYDITITPKAIHRPSATAAPKKPVPTQPVRKKSKAGETKAGQTGKGQSSQKTLPVKTSDAGNEALYLIVLGSAVVVMTVMIQIRRKGRRHE